MRDDHESERSRELERQLAWAQKITHIGSWEWRLETNRVTWSDELYRIYGLEPQSREITFDVFVSFLHPDDRERVQGEVRRALESKNGFAYVERIVRPDGTVRELDTVGEVACDSSGRVVGLIGTCRDVTEERKRDETLYVCASIVERVQIGLWVWSFDTPDRMVEARLRTFNRAAETIARAPLANQLGRKLAEILPAVVSTELPPTLERVAQSGVAEEIPAFTDEIGRVFRIKVFPLSSHTIGVAAEDITRETSARQLKAAEQRVLEMIASGAELSAVLSRIAKVIEQQAPETLASILFVEDGRVRHGAAPSLPEAFVRAIDGAPIGPSAGSCGTAAYRGEPVFVTDIETDPLWEDYRELARAHGLRACWSRPIFTADGRVGGTFALYYKNARSPSREELDLTERAAHLVRIAMQRDDLIERLRALTAHVESVREEERTGIAREIHDELGQTLTVFKMDLDWIDRRLRAGTVDADAIAERTKGMSRMTDELVDRVRRISAELRPGVLDDLGLLAALEWQGQELEKRTGIACFIEGATAPEKLDREVSTAVFRIFQEALTNVVRHAGARRIDVRLAEQAGMLRLVVDDDGKGVEPSIVDRRTSFGVLGMRERALRLGGSASIERRPEGGTRVVVDVPLAERGRGGAI